MPTHKDASKPARPDAGAGPRTITVDRGLAARHAALRVLRGVRDHEVFDVAFGRAVEGLAEPDRRLVHEIAAGVLRGRATVDEVLIPRVTGDWRRIAEDVRDVLRIGAYQLHVLSRVPVHAAVAATVEVAKREHGPRVAGFVNAVLRRLARELAEGTNGTSASPPDTQDPHTLARVHSHPVWLVARWLARFGPASTEALLRHNNQRSPIHLQPARWDEERLAEALSTAGIPFRTTSGLPGVAVQGVRVHDLPGFAEGAFVVQDPAQALALAHVAIPPGVLVWDACAAPGGKAARLGARGPVVASDPRRARLPRLIDTVRRTAPNVWVVCADALAAPVRRASFDAVVLDVPCSATGTIAKHPDARWSLTTQRIERLAALQRALLDAVADAVRPGGVLAYLTCSLEPEENAEQIAGFLERRSEFRRSADDLVLFPPDRGTDGAFAARLERAG